MSDSTAGGMDPGSPELDHDSQRLARVNSPADQFGRFVRSRTGALLRTAYLLTGDQYLAEDLVQSALGRTHQSLQRLRDSGNAEAYARRVMHRLQVARWRRHRVAESLRREVPESGAATADPVEALVNRLALRNALLKLTAKQRAVLVARFFDDRSEVETAELLDVSLGTVKSKTAKALARMRTVAPELSERYQQEGSTR